FDLVGGDRHADSGAADEQAHIGLAVGDGEPDAVSGLGVIDDVAGALGDDLDFVPVAPEFVGEHLGGGDPAAIGGHGDAHTGLPTGKGRRPNTGSERRTRTLALSALTPGAAYSASSSTSRRRTASVSRSAVRV